MSKIQDLSILGAGARNNKYRILIPGLGGDIDVLVHNVMSPGHTLGEAEVYLKGRKYKLAGDRSDEGAVTFSFYNEPDLKTRKFFMDQINTIQNFETPDGVYGSSYNNIYDFSNFFGILALSDTNISYQYNIVIEQLDHNSKVTSRNTLHNAFVTSVSDLEYQDETGEVSQTEVTMAFTANTLA